MSVISSWLAAEGSSSVLHPFQTLSGDLIGTADRGERVVYKGVEGVGLWFTGERGKPFALRSMCDYGSVALATSAFSGYLNAVGTKKDLYYRGELFATVVVHDVTLNNVKAVGTVVGGINVADGNSGAILKATWNFEALP